VSAEKFLDTSYAIGLVSESDRHHARALAWADRLEAEGTRLITTRAVFLEIGNALGKKRFRATAFQLLLALESDPTLTIVPFTDDLYARALDLYQHRPDRIGA
jgi:uncharacterized protein